MANKEKIHEHILGLGDKDSPYDLTKFPYEWNEPNKPIVELSKIESVREALNKGSEIFLIFEDQTFIVSLHQEEDGYQFINVDFIVPVESEEENIKQVRIRPSAMGQQLMNSDRIIRRFEETLGLR